MNSEEIANRFRRHRPADAQQTVAMERAHEIFLFTAQQLNDLMPNEGRHKSLAITHLEEALHWTIGAIIVPPRDNE